MARTTFHKAEAALNGIEETLAAPSEEAAWTEPIQKDLVLCKGARVRLAGLQSRPDLNGTFGVLESFDQAKGRWGVKLEGVKSQATKAI